MYVSTHTCSSADRRRVAVLHCVVPLVQEAGHHALSCAGERTVECSCKHSAAAVPGVLACRNPPGHTHCSHCFTLTVWADSGGHTASPNFCVRVRADIRLRWNSSPASDYSSVLCPTRW